MVYWVMRSLGANVSETVLTKNQHPLVTHGPYQWIRHPLYSVSTVGFLALGLMAANAFLLGLAGIGLAAICFLVIRPSRRSSWRSSGSPITNTWAGPAGGYAASAVWGELRHLLQEGTAAPGHQVREVPGAFVSRL